MFLKHSAKFLVQTPLFIRAFGKMGICLTSNETGHMRHEWVDLSGEDKFECYQEDAAFLKRIAISAYNRFLRCISLAMALIMSYVSEDILLS